MLKHLYIKNFVLIDEMNLDLEEGFSAFTGETGAGKSIFIDAISVLAAERASSSFVMKGKDKAIIEGTFDLSKDPHAIRVMNEAGFEVQEMTTFTREISSSGKSVARIDHRMATLSLLKEILEKEIDIHGQRDNAYLLNTSEHIHLLDQYLEDDELLNPVKESYRKYEQLLKEKENALNETYNENDLEYFRFEVQEIEEADLKVGEDEELEAKEKQFKAVKESFDKMNAIFSLYDESVSSDLYELNRMVQALKADDHLEEIQTSINDSYYALSDAMDSLHGFLDDMNLSEEDVNEMEERLFLIQRLKRKYGRTIEDIFEKRDELESQIRVITHRQEYLEAMDARIASALADYHKKASKLSEKRQKGCAGLDQAIAAILVDLKLPNARFKTEITHCDPTLYGSEKVQFLISMNKGEDLKPLSKTASGGELSRLMLGLKVIFTKLQGIQTVIFDEIDTGVSGPVASAIGKKMEELSADCQVFSVTHLAQVAACADHNYLVSKSDDEEHTRSNVKMLNDEEVIDQLALIASGEITDVSREAARELYRRNQTK